MADQRTILIIDDDAVLADLYRVKFERSGFRVAVCHNGREGFDALKNGLKPDILLLDVIMPQMDGFAFLREAKFKELPLPPVIVMTNEKEDVYKMEAIIRGAHYFLSKATATPQEVLEKIEGILSAQKNA